MSDKLSTPSSSMSGSHLQVGYWINSGLYRIQWDVVRMTFLLTSREKTTKENGGGEQGKGDKEKDFAEDL